MTYQKTRVPLHSVSIIVSSKYENRCRFPLPLRSCSKFHLGEKTRRKTESPADTRSSSGSNRSPSKFRTGARGSNVNSELTDRHQFGYERITRSKETLSSGEQKLLPGEIKESGFQWRVRPRLRSYSFSPLLPLTAHSIVIQLASVLFFPRSDKTQLRANRGKSAKSNTTGNE